MSKRKEYYIQCRLCFEMVSPMTRANYEQYQGISMSNKDMIAVCKCGGVEFIVGYEDD